MKKFILRTFVFIVPIAICSLAILMQADGGTDPIYLRFTTAKQCSMIIGTSRAAQGIQPVILNAELNRSDIYNYSFTIEHSPFGPTYFNSIKNKLNEHCKDGIFIIAVDPWCVSAPISNPEDSLNFKEAKMALGNTLAVDRNPNLIYLWKNFDEPLYTLITKPKSKMFLHDDGWLEVTVSMTEEAVIARTDRKIGEYKKDKLYQFAYSDLRINYLIKTIELLKEHGEVHLVRLPIHSRMMELENEFLPSFNAEMDSIASRQQIPYLDLTFLNDSLAFTDGNHLYKTSGADLTKRLASFIDK